MEYGNFLSLPFLKEVSLRKLTLKNENKEISKNAFKISKLFVEKDLNLIDENDHSE